MNITYETNFPASIINTESKIKISLFMPTHRTSPDNKKDSLVFKNLVNQIEDTLKERNELSLFSNLIGKLRELQNDSLFWTHQKEGLGILADNENISIYQVNRSFDESATVGSLFYIKPLLRHFQSSDQYYLLGLYKDAFQVFEGNRYGFGLIDFPADKAMTITEVLGGPGELNASYDPRLRNHQSTRDDNRLDVERFYRYVHKFIDSELDVSVNKPVILIGTSELVGIFRSLGDKEAVLDKAIIQSTESVFENINDLNVLVWEILEPHFLKKTQTLENLYEQLQMKEQSSSDIADIITALHDGKVQTLVLEADRKIDNIYESLADYSQEDETLSILADIALKNGVNVVVLPGIRMPNDSGAFALYRY